MAHKFFSTSAHKFFSTLGRASARLMAPQILFLHDYKLSVSMEKHQ
jgi:hypothetical protein